MQAPSAALRPLNQPRSVSSRAISIGIAVVLNVAIIYLLASGLGADAVKLVIQNIDVAVIEPPADETKPPPPPPPVEREPPPFVPPPDINIDLPAEAPATTTITTTTEQPRPAAPAPSMATPPKGSNQNRVSRSDYPPVSLRLNEMGVTIVTVQIDATGTVVSAELAKSSGHSRLDEKALLIVRSRFRYTPAKDAAGNPIPATIRQGVKWDLSG
jgi:periplasmic protein TonB